MNGGNEFMLMGCCGSAVLVLHWSCTFSYINFIYTSIIVIYQTYNSAIDIEMPVYIVRNNAHSYDTP